MREATVYKITNKINNKSYIGQTVNLKRRISAHKHSSRNENTAEYHLELYCDVRKYGWENFTFEKLEICNENTALERESYYIDLYDTKENGYNLFGGKDGLAKSTREKWSKEKEFNRAQLSYEDVVYIRKHYLNGGKPSEIYPKFKDVITHYYSFMNIWTGTRYGYVMPEVFDLRPNRVKLDYEKAQDIRKLYKEGVPYREIAEIYGVGRSTVVDVIKHRTWKTPPNP